MVWVLDETSNNQKVPNSTTPPAPKTFPWWAALLIPGVGTAAFFAYLLGKKKKKEKKSLKK